MMTSMSGRLVVSRSGRRRRRRRYDSTTRLNYIERLNELTFRVIYFRQTNTLNNDDDDERCKMGGWVGGLGTCTCCDQTKKIKIQNEMK